MMRLMTVRAACGLALPLLLSTAASAQFVNGDFQTGALAPAMTTYDFSTTMIPAGSWNIVEFNTIHGSWPDFHDHTVGGPGGWYMIINGKTNADTYAWAQEVTVTPGAEYEIGGWFASLFGQAALRFRVVWAGGELVVSNFTSPPGPAGIWAERSFTFTAPAAEIRVELWDTNMAFTGNDYAVDDLWLAPIFSACYANCDASTTAPVLNVADFSCFLTKFAAGDAYANCDGSTQEPVLNVADFSCFLTKFAAGCP